LAAITAESAAFSGVFRKGLQAERPGPKEHFKREKINMQAGDERH
jgi:hypothetical protein